MEFSIERAQLARLIKHAGRAVENRNTIPILGCLRLTASAGKLTVTATNLEVTATAAGPADVTAEGAACVGAKLLADIAAKASGTVIEFSTEPDTLIVKAGRSLFKLATVAAEDFPEPDEAAYDAHFNADLSSLFGGVSFAMSTEETRYYLNGVYLAGSGSWLTAVATDGHRLARNVISSDAAFAGVIVPAKTVALVGDGIASVSVSQNRIRISQASGADDEFVIVSRLIDGTFPDYERVIPKENDRLVTVDRDDMMRAAERVVAISSEKGRWVKLSIAPGSVTLSAKSEVGEAIDEIEAVYADEPIDIGFNSRYVRDMFSALPSGPVEVALRDNNTPALVRSLGREGWEGVIMPMRVV